MRRLAILLLRGYQLVVSPWLPPACRFIPTCSNYAIGCYERHGALRGTWLTLRRLARCQPFCAAGHDPVPTSPTSEMRDTG